MSTAAVTITDTLARLQSMQADLAGIGEFAESDELYQAARLVAQAQELISAARRDKPHLLQERSETSREDFIENIVEVFGSQKGATVTRREVAGGFDHVLELKVEGVSMKARTFLRPLYAIAVSGTIRLERPGTIVVIVNPEARGPVEAIHGGATELAEFLAS